MKKIIIAIVVIVLLVIGGYFFINKPADKYGVVEDDSAMVKEADQMEEEVKEVDKTKTMIGKSVEGRDIIAYHYGDLGGGDVKDVLFVGGIHGGYEWNTVLAAYEAMDYFASGDVVPAGVRATVIPVLNPDGLNKTVGTAERFTKADVPTGEGATVPGRFNANDVDLNRNFDCDWKATGKWQSRDVSGGTSAFSEPESQAIKAYVESNAPDAVVVYYSAAGGVFASNCHNGVLPETTTLTNLYAKASGYPAFREFNFYEITGDMVNWLAKMEIPAISVLLTDHTDTEWTKNQKGIDAVLKYLAE